MATVQQSYRRTSSSALGRLLSLAAFLAMTSVTAALGSIATRDGKAYVDSLREPAIAPPDWVFGPVWTTLYVFIAVAGWLVYRSAGRARKLALGMWALQLVLNGLWSWLFFKFERPGAGLVEVVVLLAAILVTVGLFWRLSRAAALFMAPYAAWVGFATALTFEYWRLN